MCVVCVCRRRVCEWCEGRREEEGSVMMRLRKRGHVNAGYLTHCRDHELDIFTHNQWIGCEALVLCWKTLPRSSLAFSHWPDWMLHHHHHQPPPPHASLPSLRTPHKQSTGYIHHPAQAPALSPPFRQSLPSWPRPPRK